MSNIQRYRINPVVWKNGVGWVKKSIHDKPSVIAQEQAHKRGGWVKYTDVKALEKKLTAAKEDIRILESNDEFIRSVIINSVSPQMYGFTVEQVVELLRKEKLKQIKGTSE